MEQNFLNSPSERERGGRKKSEETEKVFGGWKGERRFAGKKEGRKEERREGGLRVKRERRNAKRCLPGKIGTEKRKNGL